MISLPQFVASKKVRTIAFYMSVVAVAAWIGIPWFISADRSHASTEEHEESIAAIEEAIDSIDDAIDSIDRRFCQEEIEKCLVREDARENDCIAAAETKEDAVVCTRAAVDPGYCVRETKCPESEDSE